MNFIKFCILKYTYILSFVNIIILMEFIYFLLNLIDSLITLDKVVLYIRIKIKIYVNFYIIKKIN